MKRIGLVIAALAATLVPTTRAVAAPVFTENIAFATKTGFRAVIAWETSEAALVKAEYGIQGQTQNLTSLPTSPDTAGAIFLEGLTAGQTYTYTLLDQISGARSAQASFLATNAYTESYGGLANPYDINLVAQIDAPAVEAGTAALDLTLTEVANGMDVLAERTFDALDGHARIARVLVMDTSSDYTVNQPFISTGTCRLTRGNFADILFETPVPFDSHTYGGFAINDPCTQIYMGRAGQLLASTYRGATHLGYVATHELMHYAFSTPDLYSVTGSGGCTNSDWDGSIMHNTGGYSAGRWNLTELDESAALTPCAGLPAGSKTSWRNAQNRYALPNRTSLDNAVQTLATGNPDGGKLEVWVLSKKPGISTLTRI